MGLGLASAIMHDIAAATIGIMAMLPLMKAAGIHPGSRTGIFLMIALPFSCSAGGMGTLVGGGRNMVSAAFLKDITGIEISFIDWAIYAYPAAMLQFLPYG
nr:SLC13 family permease [Desulforamulus aquiferis]